MSSLVERLRIRSERKPLYNLDESDDEDFVLSKHAKSQDIIEKIVRDDAKDGCCQSCGSCTHCYHPKCLLPPLKANLHSNWKCPECVSPLNDIDKLLDSEMRPTVAEGSDISNLGLNQIFVKKYLVKWKGLSYLHCTWVPEKAFKSNPRLKTKVNNFRRQMESSKTSEDEFIAIRPEWTTVDRILACRGEEDKKEYLVKYKELPYDECYWEFESDISAFQPEIEKFNKIQARRKQRKQKNSLADDIDSKKKSKEF